MQTAVRSLDEWQTKNSGLPAFLAGCFFVLDTSRNFVMASEDRCGRPCGTSPGPTCPRVCGHVDVRCMPLGQARVLARNLKHSALEPDGVRPGLQPPFGYGLLTWVALHNFLYGTPRLLVEVLVGDPWPTISWPFFPQRRQGTAEKPGRGRARPRQRASTTFRIDSPRLAPSAKLSGTPDNRFPFLPSTGSPSSKKPAAHAASQHPAVSGMRWPPPCPLTPFQADSQWGLPNSDYTTPT